MGLETAIEIIDREMTIEDGSDFVCIILAENRFLHLIKSKRYTSIYKAEHSQKGGLMITNIL